MSKSGDLETGMLGHSALLIHYSHMHSNLVKILTESHKLRNSASAPVFCLCPRDQMAGHLRINCCFRVKDMLKIRTGE